MRYPMIIVLALLVTATGAETGATADPPAIQGPPPTPERPEINVTPTGELTGPGVLTPPGALVFEPSVQYQHTNINTFVAGGVAILDTVLVGDIQATQANRDAVTGTLAMRYGLTRFLEAELRLPYMYRHDSVTNTLVNTNNTSESTELKDSGLGDVEAALHCQLNAGEGDWPIFVPNLRVKSDTGLGPFDVRRDTLGVPRQLATGSGSWGIEPSLTLISASDPAVFFVNAGYLFNFSESLNRPYNANINLRHVDPGGAIRLGMGMGVALNERISYSIGYQEDFIGGTQTRFSDSSSFKSASLSAGTLNLGMNWQRDQRTAVTITLGVGVTRDAPDASLTLRIPISVQLF